MQLNLGELPPTIPDENSPDEVLKQVHRALLEVHVKEGELVSKEGARYKISKSIPNMMIADVVQDSKEENGGEKSANEASDSEED